MRAPVFGAGMEQGVLLPVKFHGDDEISACPDIERGVGLYPSPAKIQFRKAVIWQLISLEKI